MKPAQATHQRSLRLAAICAVCLLVAGAGLAGATRLSGSLDDQIKHARSQNGELQAEQAALRSRLELARTGADVFEQYRRSGLIGPAQRERWASGLVTATRARGFAAQPAYTLEKPEPLSATPGGADVAPAGPAEPPAGAALPGIAGGPANAPAQATAPVEVHAHALKFRLTDAHELDVIAILDHLRQIAAGGVQARECSMTDAKPQGLKASCTLRFFNVTRGKAGATDSLTQAASFDLAAERPAPPLPLLGALMLKPAERAAIERARRHASTTAAADGLPSARADEEPQSLRLDGIVSIQGGTRTAIVSGQPGTHDEAAQDRPQVLNATTARVAGETRLRVGEVLQSSEPADLVPRGSVVSGRATATLEARRGTPPLQVSPPPGTR